MAQITMHTIANDDKENETKTAVSKRVRPLLGLNAQSWEQLMLLSLAVVGFFGVVVAFTTAGVVISQRRENAETKAEFDRYKVETGKIIAIANAQAEEAKQKANEADLARLKLEAQPAPRTIVDPDRFAKVVRPFRGTAVHVWIFTAGTADTSPFGQLLVEQLKNAGWEVGLSNSLSGQSVPGIEVGAKKGSGAENAALAIASAIKMYTNARVRLVDPYDTEPSFGASVGQSTEKPATVTLVVGSK